MSGVSEIAAQIFVLFVLAGGGGCWLWFLTGRPPAARRYNWLWFGLAGLALGALVLQSLLYCGVPLKISTWPVLAAALVGWFVAARYWRRTGFSSPAGIRRETGAALLVFVVALAGQAPPLVQHGPARFYGTGSYDQGNYVALGDLFVNVPLSVQASTVEYRPWLVPVLKPKEQRITQSVLLGTVAAATRSSSQEAYGATNLFLIALAGLATLGTLRVVGTPRWFAACAGLVAALSPALTRVHLEGYFSQTASLFIYPALIGIFGGKGPLRREAKVTGAVLLACLSSVYSEVAVFGFGLVGILVWMVESPWRMRIRSLLQIFLGALLFNPGYWGRLAAFLITQWQAAGEVAGYAALFPDSGSLAGWGRWFFDGRWTLLMQIIGLAWMALMVLGAGRLIRVHRPAMVVALGLAVAALAVLALRTPFSGYVFAKLCIQFTPLWIAVGTSGLLLLVAPRYWRRWPLKGVVLAMVGLSWWGAQPWREKVMRPEGSLAVLSSARVLAIRQDAEEHPERTYLVACDDPVLTQWLCYFGRRSAVVVDRRTVGDRILPTENYACRRWPGSVENLFWLDLERSGRVDGYEPAPGLAILGAQDVVDAEGGKQYLAGTTLNMVFQRPADGTPRKIWFDFAVVSGRPGQACQLELADPAGRRWRTVIRGAGWCRWPLVLNPGTSHFRLQLQADQTVGDQPVALIKLLSVETSPALPAWQGIQVAEPVR